MTFSLWVCAVQTSGSSPSVQNGRFVEIEFGGGFLHGGFLDGIGAGCA